MEEILALILSQLLEAGIKYTIKVTSKNPYEKEEKSDIIRI